jgi:starch synthase
MDEGFQIVLCAGAPDTPDIGREMKEAVAQVQAQHGGVIWIDEMVDKQTVRELYSNASVFCCPSIYEPFGIINLEAMACGAPVVASATGGILEVVVDGETGYLVPFEADSTTGFPVDGDLFARDLAKRLTELMGNPELCKKFGNAGRKRVEETFSWDAIAKQTVELYRSLTKK